MQSTPYLRFASTVAIAVIAFGVHAAPPLYTVTDLGTLGGTRSIGLGINAKGEVVGWSLDVHANKHAILYNRAQLHDLGTLGGTRSQANTINNRGDIVGSSRLAGDSAPMHSFSPEE